MTSARRPLLKRMKILKVWPRITPEAFWLTIASLAWAAFLWASGFTDSSIFQTCSSGLVSKKSTDPRFEVLTGQFNPFHAL